MPSPAEADRRSSRSPKAKRADAERSIAAILDGALVCFGRSPDASMTEIAAEAGVGRVTLYAHFDSREAVLRALLSRSLAEADAVMAEAEPDRGPAPEALDRLLHAPWLLERYRGLYAAAVRHLGAGHVRVQHDVVFTRIQALIERGQKEGAFRSDMPITWLVSTVYALAHAAITEVDEGRMEIGQATDLLTATVLAMLRP